MIETAELFARMTCAIEDIAISTERFIKISKKRLTSADPTMSGTLMILAGAYRDGTGRDPTHSSHVDGQHVGEPRSEFGRFVVAFFAIVSPEVSKTALTTEVRNYVAGLKE